MHNANFDTIKKLANYITKLVEEIDNRQEAKGLVVIFCYFVLFYKMIYSGPVALIYNKSILIIITKMPSTHVFNELCVKICLLRSVKKKNVTECNAVYFRLCIDLHSSQLGRFRTYTKPRLY